VSKEDLPEDIKLYYQRLAKEALIEDMHPTSVEQEEFLRDKQLLDMEYLEILAKIRNTQQE